MAFLIDAAVLFFCLNEKRKDTRRATSVPATQVYAEYDQEQASLL